MKYAKNIAVIGIGHWGKNLLREFGKIARVEYVYHRGNAQNSNWLKQNYPTIRMAVSYDQILKNSTVDAVIIATPIKTHYELARKALLAGKDVFVEKPITENVKQAEELVRLAAKKKRILFVGHIFSHHPVLAKIKSITRHEPIKHAEFTWNKLGTFKEKLIYNLASHDIATAINLFGKPSKIKAHGNLALKANPDVVNLRLDFKNNKFSNIYINRISNVKNKKVVLTTVRNTYLWGNDELFKLNRENNTLQQIYKSSETPLEIECQEFIKCLISRKKPSTDGKFGLEVVKIISEI